ncbi:MAG: conjugal transfer protein [Microbacterium sp.]|uniref:conjugal transfer protein n=1 Tax=Microbacterium sp. TaxID=51671 RepID=UPI001D26653D|nr:conjugal transfer protein [Microbacterium sp.]MBW8764534.1 conjugal transfer protein [Microbacterium sp.]
MALSIGKKRQKSQPAEPVDPALAAWVAQGEESSHGTPWRDAKAEKRSPWWWILRALFVVVVLVLLGLVVRSVLTSQNAAPVVVETEAPFPDAEARTLSERFVESFYSWDSANPQQRKLNLSADVPMDGSMTSGLGWDGKGHQIASDARATTVATTDDGITHVSVVFRLVTFDVDGAALPPVWAQAVVPLTAEGKGSQVAIAGMPGLVPLDEPLASTAEDPEMDNDITRETKDYADSFFAALGAQEDVNAEAAPGSHIRGLAGAVELVRVDTWKVWAGDGHTREAVAVVVWRNGTTEFTNEYALTLTQITGGGQSKWLVSAIHGAAK